MSSAKDGARASVSKTTGRRKYLGDPNDPHFVPSSPIISRQQLSFEQEEELTKVCTLVLEGVQHSDDGEEDPLMKYVSHQLVPRQTRVQVPKDKPTVPRASIVPRNDMHLRSQRLRREAEETATPSMSSKRDTIDRTNTSTPLTMLSETLRKTSGGRQENGLRSKSISPQPRTVGAYLEKSHSNCGQREATAASKSMISLPSSPESLEHKPITVTASKIGRITVSQVEFNKSLPSLPQYDNHATAEKPTGGFSQMLRAATRKQKHSDAILTKTQTHEFSNVQRCQTAPVSPVVKKSMFNLASIFHRKRKQQPSQVAVS